MGSTCDNTVTAITSFQAWERWWFSGAPDTVCHFFLGIPMFWWSRIGGLIGFAGGFLVVAEIIDLQRFADMLSERLFSLFQRSAKTVWRLRIPIMTVLGMVFLIGVVISYIHIYGVKGYEKRLVCGNLDIPAPAICTKAEAWHYFLQSIPFIFIYVTGPIISVVVVALTLGVIIPYVVLTPFASFLRILPQWKPVLSLLVGTIGFICAFLTS